MGILAGIPFRQSQQRLTPTVTTPSNLRSDIRASFATAFSMWRRNNHIPLRQVAKDLGLSGATINAWELDRCFPSGDHLERLANYTGLPPCRLVCVMADQCVPTDCLLAMDRKPSGAKR